MPAKGLPLQLHFYAVVRNTGYMNFYIKLRAYIFARSHLLWASIATLLLWIVGLSWKFFQCYPCLVAGNRQVLLMHL